MHRLKAMAGRARERLDILLVERGLCQSRTRAQALIMAGKVLVKGQPVTKAGTRVERGASIWLKEPEHSFASRGGMKLSGALDDFNLSVDGQQALDVGASTGGFTDCLLQRGASRVFALDVGRGQLDWKLQKDPRVVRLEGLNVRHLQPDHLPAPVDLATIDVSFISLRLVLGPVAAVVRPGGKLLVLVKPQFELERRLVVKGGVVRDDALRQRAVEQVSAHAESIGLRVLGRAESRLAGADGNREIFLLLARP